MKKTVFVILVFIGALILLIRFGVTPLIGALGFNQKAGVKVTSIPADISVSINGKEMGKTPYENKDLRPGEYLVKLSSDIGKWEGKVKIQRGTLAVINRELGENIASSSGETLTLAKGKGVTITSQPDGAMVQVDGKDYGKTPLAITDLTIGEHTFLLSHDSYLKRSIRAYIPEKLGLFISVDLSLTEVDLATIPSTPQTQQVEVVVKQTPTGFLRVREKPSTQSTELTRVNTGDTLTVLEELPSWYKVKLEGGVEGYVSATYVTKKTQ